MEKNLTTSDVALTPSEQSAVANSVESGNDQTVNPSRKAESLQLPPSITVAIDAAKEAESPTVHAAISTAVASTIDDIERELEMQIAC